MTDFLSRDADRTAISTDAQLIVDSMVTIAALPAADRLAAPERVTVMKATARIAKLVGAWNISGSDG